MNSPYVFVPYLEEGEIDLDHLERLLKQALSSVETDQVAKKQLFSESNFRKCIRINDFLRCGNRKYPDLYQ